MNRILVSSLALAAAGALGAQEPVKPAAATAPIQLDAIVAVVGDQPITRYDLREAVLTKIQAKAAKEPTDSISAFKLDSATLDEMIQDELLLQKAKELKIETPDADIAPQVDQQIRDIRGQFPTEAKFREELAKASLGSPEEYRKFLMEQYRRQATRQKVLQKLQQDGKIVPVNVTDAEISAEFERSKEFIPPKPATVSFKQIVIMPSATPAAKEVARVKAESVLAQLKSGADFEQIAKRESMDPLTKSTGGDLGWVRRGERVPEIDRWLFGTPYQTALPPGQLSPVFETMFGYHILRVDRVQPGEVKAHQILIAPKIDSADIARTAKLADSVADRLRAGAPFDTLARKYNDYAGKEETNIPEFERDKLPAAYQAALLTKKPGDIVAFQIPGAANRPDVPKYVVAQLLTVQEAGERTLPEMRELVRNELAQRGGVRRYIDGLKKQTYVSVRLADSGKN